MAGQSGLGQAAWLHSGCACRGKPQSQLNEAPELDAGNPAELGREYARLKRRLNQLTVMGGCCGTDHRHIEQIALACQPLFEPAA
ncbi:homocysteine S-methyltransferase family protein [Polaromonas sp.]|uniref:homocysteine S-methyltransferase family protein n=1 Tax=Polaromonas sp. TaxID=1869339 RepID=UPI00351FD21F